MLLPVSIPVLRSVGMDHSRLVVVPVALPVSEPILHSVGTDHSRQVPVPVALTVSIPEFRSVGIDLSRQVSVPVELSVSISKDDRIVFDPTAAIKKRGNDALDLLIGEERRCGYEKMNEINHLLEFLSSRMSV